MHYVHVKGRLPPTQAWGNPPPLPSLTAAIFMSINNFMFALPLAASREQTPTHILSNDGTPKELVFESDACAVPWDCVVVGIDPALKHLLPSLEGLHLAGARIHSSELARRQYVEAGDCGGMGTEYQTFYASVGMGNGLTRIDDFAGIVYIVM